LVCQDELFANNLLDITRLEWGPLSLVRINEELLEREVAAPV
jgi:hypothetical protein